jgi:hypothetical protein
VDEASVTSQGLPSSLPDAWAEKLFQVLENRYGAKWIDSLGGIARERVRRAWAEDLAGFSGEELKRGIDALRTKVWPPTLPEFILLCRPLADSKADYAEACEQMTLRLRGRGEDSWSRPQVYWAAVTIGAHDLNTFGWDQLRARWERALAMAGDASVPEYMAQLPPPGRTAVPRDEARKRMGELNARLASEFSADSIRSGKQWAIDLMHKEADGEYVAFVAHDAWRDALGFDAKVSAAEAVRMYGQRMAA